MRTYRHAQRLLLGLTLGLTVATPLASYAGAHGKDPALGGELYDINQVLVYRWRAGFEPPPDIKTAIHEAARDVRATLASRAATFTYASDGTSQIGYGTGSCGVNGIACFTRSAPDSFTMWLREQGRVYDWGTLKWCQAYDDPPDGCYDAETIALDEFGHVEGLDHHVNYADESDYRDAVVQTFSRTKPKLGWNMHTLGVCDIATLQLLYDTPGASFPYSTCLNLETVLALRVNDASVPYGATVTVTSELRVETNSVYGEMSNNPVSKRTVRLQRRPPGTTTWTTVATMTPSTPTGTYVTSVKLQSSSEFRAVYSTPTTEGLNGDVSPTIKVTVGMCTGSCPTSAEP